MNNVNIPVSFPLVEAPLKLWSFTVVFLLISSMFASLEINFKLRKQKKSHKKLQVLVSMKGVALTQTAKQKGSRVLNK